MEKRIRIAVSAERSSAFGRRFIGGIAEVAERHPEWELALLEPATIRRKAAAAYDAWICRVTNAASAAALAASGRPVVDCLCTSVQPGFATVRTDAEAIGRLAAEHLRALRFVNFAFCGYRRVAFSDRRRDAFARALEACGVRPFLYRPPLRAQNRFGRDFLLGNRLEAPPDAADLAAWLRRLPKPVGVFCCDDLRASQLRDVCRRLGLAVPDDVAILGVDDDPIYCLFKSPRLSSIDPDGRACGVCAAEALAARLAAPGDPPPHRVVPPKGVVMRTSTDVLPGAPAWLAEACRFIRAHVADGISAADVFRHVGYSHTVVERAFRDTLGQSVLARITETRLDEACRLLKTTALPVKQVAAAAGFSSLEYFSRVFVAAKGLPASAWRTRRKPVG
jgi:LacI family transcriptional regulator